MKRIVEVTQTVMVELDEAKFDEKFMQEFRDSFYDFNSLDEHAEHIAQLAARGFSMFPSSFVEGYGVLSDAGIKVEVENNITTDVLGDVG